MNFIDELIGKMYLTQNYIRTLNGINFFQYYLMEKNREKTVINCIISFQLVLKISYTFEVIIITIIIIIVKPGTH